MAGNPILLPDGNAVTAWDNDVIEVTGQGGRKTRIARAAAPIELQQAVAGAESGSLVASPPPQASNPFGNIDPNTPGPGVRIPPPGAVSPAAPAAPDDTAPDAVAGQLANPMAAAQAEYARLRSMPQVAMSGGGERKTTSVTRMPESARADVIDAQTPIDEAQAEREIAIEEQGAAEEAALAKVSQLHAEQGRRIQGEVDAQETLQQSFAQRQQTEEKKLNDLNRAAQVEIDPKRYWKNQGTGNQILAVISAAIGGYVEGLTGGRVKNRALDMIQQAIDRDIGVQIQNRDRAERDVGRQTQLMQMVSTQYDDQTQRRNAALVLANEAVAKQIDGISAGLGSEQAKAKAAELAAQLRQANAQRAQELIMSTAGSETVQTQQVPGGLVKTGEGRAADAMQQYLYGPESSYNPETYIPASMLVMGEHRAALNKSDQVELNKLMSTNQAMLRKIDQIEDLAKQGSKLSPQKKTQVTQLYNSLLLDIKTGEDLGALDAGATVVGKEIIGPNPSDMTSIANGAPQLRSMVKSKGRDAMRNRTRPIDPLTIPAVTRSQGVGAQASSAPPTRPLAMEESP